MRGGSRNPKPKFCPLPVHIQAYFHRDRHQRGEVTRTPGPQSEKYSHVCFHCLKWMRAKITTVRNSNRAMWPCHGTCTQTHRPVRSGALPAPGAVAGVSPCVVDIYREHRHAACLVATSTFTNTLASSSVSESFSST